MQPLRPAGAASAPALDDDVPDLAGGAAAEPLLPVQDQAAADAGAPPDAEDGLELLARLRARTRPERRPRRRCRSGPGRRDPWRVSRRAGTSRSSPAGCGRPRRRRSPRPRRRASPCRSPSGRGCRVRPVPPPLASPRPPRAPRPPGRPCPGVGRRDCPRTLLSASTTTVWILVPPRSMPPRAACFESGLTPQTISGGNRVFCEAPAVASWSQWRTWRVKRRWYERNHRRRGRRRINRHAAEGGFFIRYPVEGEVLEALDSGRLRDRRGNAARARLLADALGRTRGSASARAASSTATRCSRPSS